MSHQKPTLHYFNMKGRAELVRLTFAAAGIDYVDDRFQREQWPELKKTAPTGVAPWLDTEQGTMVQSNAIARYFAKKYGLMGQTDWEYYLVERALAQLDDIIGEILKVYMSPEDKKAAAVAEFLTGKGHLLATNLVGFLKDGGDSGLFVSSGLTLADLLCLHMVDTLVFMVPQFFDKFPQLKEHTERVKSVSPKVAEWLQKRPQTSF